MKISNHKSNSIDVVDGCLTLVSPYELFVKRYKSYPNVIEYTDTDHHDKRFKRRKNIEKLTDIYINNEKLISILSNRYNVKINRYVNTNQYGEIKAENGFRTIFLFVDLPIILESTKCTITMYCLTYDKDAEDIMKYALKGISYIYQKKNEQIRQIHLITKDMSGLTLSKHVIKDVKVNIKKNYNDDFENADKLIKKFINDDEKSGLIILNGEKGTGKTTYIRHLINSFDKKFIYVTKELLNTVASPEFIPFMLKNTDAVLILEDCESVVMARKSGNASPAIANLLNLCDGIFSDVFKVKVIATFNVEIGKIDDALLRKGRLACQYTFNKLSVEKSNALLKSLKIKHTANTPMSLADIYNFNDDSNKIQETQPRRIGF